MRWSWCLISPGRRALERRTAPSGRASPSDSDCPVTTASLSSSIGARLNQSSPGRWWPGRPRAGTSPDASHRSSTKATVTSLPATASTARRSGDAAPGPGTASGGAPFCTQTASRRCTPRSWPTPHASVSQKRRWCPACLVLQSTHAHGVSGGRGKAAGRSSSVALTDAAPSFTEAMSRARQRRAVATSLGGGSSRSSAGWRLLPTTNIFADEVARKSPRLDLRRWQVDSTRTLRQRLRKGRRRRRRLLRLDPRPVPPSVRRCGASRRQLRALPVRRPATAATHSARGRPWTLASSSDREGEGRGRRRPQEMDAGEVSGAAYAAGITAQATRGGDLA
jgi:hypothetical protein